jgi:hypothetical protein
MLAETMDKEYYEYITKFASALAKVYAIADFLAQPMRSKVVTIANLRSDSARALKSAFLLRGSIHELRRAEVDY